MENMKQILPTAFIPLGTIVTVFGTGSEMNNGAARFARFAQNVWGIASKGSEEETALAGVDALAFLRIPIFGRLLILQTSQQAFV